ncbi:MAG TPA: MFS transporter [Candidatus Limnocylindrales bacterium]|nr:MFS transporter [Candidatus Limnocylindrales bacterium]
MTHGELPQDLGSQDLSGAGNVFRNQSFVLLWTAQLLSQLASNMVLAALMATVVRATGSNTANAILILSFLVPAVAFSAAAGVLVERSDARLIMLATNVLRAVGVILFIFVGPNVPLILLINLFVATMTAVFAPAELTSIPRIVERRHLMAANSVFVLTINATFAVGFGFLGPLLLTTAGVDAVFVVVAIMFGLAAAAIVPLPAVTPEKHEEFRTQDAGRALRAVVDQVSEGIAFVRQNRQIAWSLAYLGIAASLIGVLGAIGPGFATDILGLTPEDFFFIMGPAGLGAVMGILFLNAYGKSFPRRLVIDIGLVAMGITLVALAVIKPITGFLSPAVQPIEQSLPVALSPVISLIAVVVVIAVTAGVEYSFVAIPSQTALQEELPVGVRGRIFGILNTLLSVASFLPVIAAPVAADVLNILFPGAGIPWVMAILGGVTLWAGVASWRHNAAVGLHARGAPNPPPQSSSGESPAIENEGPAADAK